MLYSLLNRHHKISISCVNSNFCVQRRKDSIFGVTAAMNVCVIRAACGACAQVFVTLKEDDLQSYLDILRKDQLILDKENGKCIK